MNEINNDEINLLDLFETLWSEKLKIILSTILCVIVGIGITSTLPNSYEVSTPMRNG